MPARLLALIAAFWLAGVGAAQASAFSSWSAVVVAGDWHAHDGSASEAFDNARRDVSAALTRVGFKPQNIRQFSVRPELYADTRPEKAEMQGIANAMKALSDQAPGGCLFYISSHGSPAGAMLDEGILQPGTLATWLDQSCGARPTVVVVSACYSGVFVGVLAKPNRMVLTAARPDRTSFGCGQDNKYPFFDDCFLSSMAQAHDFGGVLGTVQECVRLREIAERVAPPSEPQVWVGPQLRPVLPLYPFDTPPKVK